jgi:hypothetical protein
MPAEGTAFKQDLRDMRYRQAFWVSALWSVALLVCQPLEGG